MGADAMPLRLEIGQARPVSTVTKPLLEVRNLNLMIRAGQSEVRFTSDIAFTIAPGEAVGLVGESGSGKTLTGLALMRLLPQHSIRSTGQIWFDGTDLLQLSEPAMRQVRGRRISMVFQEAMSALDPVFTVGEQINETIRMHFKLSRRQARSHAIDALAAVGVPAPQHRYDAYPHQLSGGLRQRVMIAIALVCEPALLIADEPTTALDVTVQAQIMELLLSKSQSLGTALLLITHDIGVVASNCARMLTMYAGQVVESGPVRQTLMRPLHPYTSGLLRSLPRLAERKSTLPVIPGRVPPPLAMPAGCRFEMRCTHRQPCCEAPQLIEPTAGREVRCCRHEELALSGIAG